MAAAASSSTYPTATYLLTLSIECSFQGDTYTKEISWKTEEDLEHTLIKINDGIASNEIFLPFFCIWMNGGNTGVNYEDIKKILASLKQMDPSFTEDRVKQLFLKVTGRVEYCSKKDTLFKGVDVSSSSVLFNNEHLKTTDELGEILSNFYVRSCKEFKCFANWFTDQHLELFKDVPVELIDLRCSSVTNEGMRALAEHRTIKCIELPEAITDLSHLASCPNLSHVSILNKYHSKADLEALSYTIRRPPKKVIIELTSLEDLPLTIQPFLDSSQSNVSCTCTGEWLTYDLLKTLITQIGNRLTSLTLLDVGIRAPMPEILSVIAANCQNLKSLLISFKNP